MFAEASSVLVVLVVGLGCGLAGFAWGLDGVAPLAGALGADLLWVETGFACELPVLGLAAVAGAVLRRDLVVLSALATALPLSATGLAVTLA